MLLDFTVRFYTKHQKCVVDCLNELGLSVETYYTTKSNGMRCASIPVNIKDLDTLLDSMLLLLIEEKVDQYSFMTYY
jgi:hypothetical protein